MTATTIQRALLKAAPNASNVVRLPTAAPRQVKQPQNAAARNARRAYKAENPWPGEFLFAGQREAMKIAEAVAAVKPSVELELLTAICAALDNDTRAKVYETLAPRVVGGRETAKQALAILRTTHMTVGEANDFYNAWRRLNAPTGEA